MTITITEPPFSDHANLQVSNLSCERSQTVLFSGLSFTLSEGDTARIAGPNGSGKTTLLRTLAGIHIPIEGQILWDNEKIHSRDRYEKVKLAYLGHTTGLRGDMTVLENLQFYASISKNPGLTPMQCLDKMTITMCCDIPCCKLSAGQKQRVALARLCLQNCRLWLLDEPTTSLDSQGIDILQDVATSHTEAGGIIIFSSHQPLEFGGNNRITVRLGTDSGQN